MEFEFGLLSVTLVPIEHEVRISEFLSQCREQVDQQEVTLRSKVAELEPGELTEYLDEMGELNRNFA